MRDLIEALTILSKYNDSRWPTHCEHDILLVNVNPLDVSDEDKKRLDELSFRPNDEYGDNIFASYRFGSC